MNPETLGPYQEDFQQKNSTESSFPLAIQHVLESLESYRGKNGQLPIQVSIVKFFAENPEKVLDRATIISESQADFQHVFYAKHGTLYTQISRARGILSQIDPQLAIYGISKTNAHVLTQRYEPHTIFQLPELGLDQKTVKKLPPDMKILSDMLQQVEVVPKKDEVKPVLNAREREILTSLIMVYPKKTHVPFFGEVQNGTINAAAAGNLATHISRLRDKIASTSFEIENKHRKKTNEIRYRLIKHSGA